MTRDITKEEQEAIKQAAWNDDYKTGYDDGVDATCTDMRVRENNSFRAGKLVGRSQIIKEIRGVQWVKLFGVVVAGSVIGCGIILALAVGLTNLPK